MRLSRTIARWILVALPTLAGLPATAMPVAYEGFGGSPGTPLIGQFGGEGFASPWIPGGYNAPQFDETVAAGSLAFGDLATSGNRASTGVHQSINGLSRFLAQPVGRPGTTEYLSVVLRPEGTLGEGVFNGFFGLVVTGQDPSNELFLGKPGGGALGDYILETRGGAGQVDSGQAAVVGQTALLVVRIDFGAEAGGNDRITLFVDPIPGGPEPLSGDAIKTDLRLGSINALTLYSTGAHSVDEIRVGPTFGDVTPAAVPEPASMALIGLGGLILLARRLRR